MHTPKRKTTTCVCLRLSASSPLGALRSLKSCKNDRVPPLCVLHSLILLQQMKSIGICESALAWVTSYLTDRTFSIKINDAISRRQQLNCGVPQGSVLGPLLFTIYCMPLTAIVAKHNLKYHMYADDTQLYVDFPCDQPCSADTATRQIEQWTIDIKCWMTSHQLLLNKTKTETIVFYAPNDKVPPGITGVDVCGCRIMPQPTVRDVGISLDSGMDMTMQVTRTCQAAYFQLHNIAKIRHCLTIAACKTIVHGLVTSKLDYGNAVLFGINGRLLQKQQRVLNSAARVITQQRRCDHPGPCIYNFFVFRFQICERKTDNEFLFRFSFSKVK